MEKESLLNQESQSTCCDCCHRLCVSANYKARVIHMNGFTNPRHFVSNGVTNTKYNIITFLPKVLLN